LDLLVVLQEVKDIILPRHLSQWLKTNNNMKKVILGLVVICLTSCGSASTEETTCDSTCVKADTVKIDSLKK
jgi:hypothetical protein